MSQAFTVNCPECGQPDTTLIEISETSEYVTVECELCSNPYVIYIQVEVTAKPYRIVKGD